MFLCESEQNLHINIISVIDEAAFMNRDMLGTAMAEISAIISGETIEGLKVYFI
jgi:hypothetical protein